MLKKEQCIAATKIATSWFKDNNTVMNPGKFQAIILDKHTGNHTNQIKKIDQKEVKAASKVKVLGIQLDDKLNFNCHLNNIYKPASNQLKTLIRLKHLLIFSGKKTLVKI